MLSPPGVDDSARIGHVVALVYSCLVADPAARCSTTALASALTSIRRADVGTSPSAAVGSPSRADAVGVPRSSPSLPPPVYASSAGGAVSPSPACYDVLAVIATLQDVCVPGDALARVFDAVGHAVTTTLDVLRECGVSGRDVLTVRKRLAVVDAVCEVRVSGLNGVYVRVSTAITCA